MSDEQDLITFMTRDELLERARSARQELVALWANLTEDQMTHRPGPQSDWSVKDLIAHLAWWENFAVTRARRLQETREFIETTDDDVDRFNAEVFETYKDKSLVDVLTFFDYSRDVILGYIEMQSDEQINEDIDGMKVLYYIIANTFGHYADHEDDLRRYIAQLA